MNLRIYSEIHVVSKILYLYLQKNKNMITESVYSTNLGNVYHGNSLDLIPELDDESVDLVVTSPPFALLRKKEYGNEEQENYISWLGEFARLIKPKLKESGSLVIDLGGAYQRGIPIRSLYNFKVAIYLNEELGYNLAEEFFWYNPSKLPSPIEWVNKKKIRAKDSVNTIWWFSKNPFPKADITKVLSPYSNRMKKLLENPEKYYSPKARPSGHQISSSFSTDNGGAIPSNLLQISNSESVSKYLSYCKKLGLKAHPARFPVKLPEFFIKLLTDENDLVIDLFGGSCTTGEACENLNRRWMCFELNRQYIAGSLFRFLPDGYSAENATELYQRIINGDNIGLLQKQII